MFKLNDDFLPAGRFASSLEQLPPIHLHLTRLSFSTYLTGTSIQGITFSFRKGVLREPYSLE